MSRPKITGRIAIMLCLGALVTPAPASAGTYEVDACNLAPEGANHSWIATSNDAAAPSHYAEHSTCPFGQGTGSTQADEEGGLSVTDVLGLSSGAAPGTSANWTFQAPVGTTITAISYEPYLGHELDGFNDWSPALRADGTIVPGQTCLDTPENGENCSVGEPANSGFDLIEVGGLSAHELAYGIACQAPEGHECVTGATRHAVWAAMYGAKVTLDDPTAPTLSEPAGPLWGPGEANGFHKGAESVTAAAEDTGSGVAKIVLSVDGRPVSTYTAPCNSTFARPCPKSTGVQPLALPTTELSDGEHTVTLAATDGAGNQSDLSSHRIIVDNNPPSAPIGLTATPTSPEGSAFVVSWSNPQSEPAPVTGAFYQVCPATGAGMCSPRAAAPATGPATISVPGPGTWSIAVWLSDAAGNANPANAARTDVAVPSPQPDGPGSRGGDAGKTTLKIRITEAIRRRKLIVRVSGPASGRVRVGFRALLKGVLVASADKTTSLRNGHLTLTFRLGPRAAGYALIRVVARLDHDAPVLSTLHRHRGGSVVGGVPGRRSARLDGGR